MCVVKVPHVRSDKTRDLIKLIKETIPRKAHTITTYVVVCV